MSLPRQLPHLRAGWYRLYSRIAGGVDGDNSCVFCSDADVLETSQAAPFLPDRRVSFDALRRAGRFLPPPPSTTAPSAVVLGAPELRFGAVAVCFPSDWGLGPLRAAPPWPLWSLDITFRFSIGTVRLKSIRRDLLSTSDVACAGRDIVAGDPGAANLSRGHRTTIGGCKISADWFVWIVSVGVGGSCESRPAQI